MQTHFEAFIDDIATCQGCQKTKQSIIQMILDCYAGETLHISANASRRVKRDTLLKQLQASGYTRAQQQRILTARLGVSRSTAYLWLKQWHNLTTT